MSPLDPCPGCGLGGADRGVAGGGEPPASHVAGPACSATWEQVLARDYSDAAYRRVHQLNVDAYVAQHAGRTGRREVQRVALCLMTLCLVVEEGVDPAEGPRRHARMVGAQLPLHWLEPPDLRGPLTVADVLAADDPDAHERVVRRWAEQVWQAWSPHHTTVRRWNALTAGPGG